MYIKLSQLLGYLAVKNDLKEEVSQFLFDLFRVILIKRLKKFILQDFSAVP
jgi:hypothetical protein